MTALLDRILDRTTMYRLVLYYLIAILVVAAGLAAFGKLPYPLLGILESVAVLLGACYVTNQVFSFVFEAPTNLESVHITALILACILPPVRSADDLPLLLWAGVLAMGAKYILAIRNKHLFNPAAIAVVLTAFWLNQSATWWIGTPYMVPAVLLGGILVVRKLRRYDQVYYFFIGALVTNCLLTALAGHDVLATLNQMFLSSPLLFFAFVMLTEPLTSPPTAFLQGTFGLLVGILFAPQVHFGTFYLTPELALIGGNIFSYVVSPKVRERLLLLRKRYVSKSVIELDFQPSRRFSYQPGQYMEFTLPHPHADPRGTRRYFTLASSPTENTVKLGVKLYPNSSTYKTSLANLEINQTLMAGQIAGDFILPKDTSLKLTFIAGGIGVTPFRSMLKYLQDTGQNRDITMMYMNRTFDEIAYVDLFSQLQGPRILYVLDEAPEGWNGLSGRLDETMLKTYVPDFMERVFYLSGPHPMVAGTSDMLRQLGLPAGQIKTDFFPGLV